jgi:hypothetical protein
MLFDVLMQGVVVTAPSTTTLAATAGVLAGVPSMDSKEAVTLVVASKATVALAMAAGAMVAEVTATTDKAVAAEVIAETVHSARFVATGGMPHSAAGTATTRCIKRMINAPETPPPLTMMISSHGSWTPVPPTTSPTTWVS